MYSRNRSLKVHLDNVCDLEPPTISRYYNCSLTPSSSTSLEDMGNVFQSSTMKMHKANLAATTLQYQNQQHEHRSQRVSRCSEPEMRKSNDTMEEIDQVHSSDQDEDHHPNHNGNQGALFLNISKSKPKVDVLLGLRGSISPLPTHRAHLQSIANYLNSKTPSSCSSSCSTDRSVSTGERSPQSAKRGIMEISSKPQEDLSYEELTPSSNPLRDVEQCCTNLSSESWEIQLRGIILVRRLARYHSSTLIPHIHQILVLLTGFVNNLRSSLSKNAIICYGEMFRAIGREIDGELDLIVPSLVKKTAEANRFINSEAEKTLLSIIHNSSPEKALSSLLQFSEQKSASIRATSAMLLNECVQRCQVRIIKSKELGRLLQAVTRYLDDGSFESRRWGRTLAYNLSNYCEGQSEFELALRKNLSNEKIKTFRDAANKGIPVGSTTETRNRLIPRVKHVSSKSGLTGNGTPKSPKEMTEDTSGIGVLRPTISKTTVPPAMIRATKSAPSSRSLPVPLSVTKRPHSHKRTSSHSSTPINSQTSDRLQLIYRSMTSSDWIMRNQGITQLQDFIFENSRNMFQQTDLIVQMFDNMLPRLSDSNSKVNIFAYRTLLQIIPILSEYLEPVCNRLFQSVCSSLSSTNSQIRSLAEESIDILVEFVPVSFLVPCIPQVVNNAKNREIVLENIRDRLLPKAYQEKPLLIQKYIIPLACKSYREGGTSLRNSYLSILRSLYSLYSEQDCSRGKELLNLISNHVTNEDYISIHNFLHKH